MKHPEKSAHSKHENASSRESSFGKMLLFAKEKKPASNGKKPIYYFGSVKARFLHPAVPGDQIKIRVENVKTLSTGAYVSGEAFVDDKKITEAVLVFSAKDE